MLVHRFFMIFAALFAVFASADESGGIAAATDGEAEFYHNVEVQFIHGRKAVLYIYNGDEQEPMDKVVLSRLRTKAEMHKVMEEKGFIKKDPEEVEKIRAERKKVNDDEERLQRERFEKRRREKELKQRFAADILREDPRKRPGQSNYNPKPKPNSPDDQRKRRQEALKLQKEKMERSVQQFRERIEKHGGTEEELEKLKEEMKIYEEKMVKLDSMRDEL